MKKILLKLALLGATLFAYNAAKAQTVAVSADLKTMFNAGAATKTQVCFSLTDGNGNQLSNPRTSSGVIVPTATQCVLPDGSGHVSTTVIANDQITPANSIYSVTYTFNGRVVHGDIFQFALADGTENLNTKTSLSTIPVIPAPTGDTTYLRLDGGNNPLAFLNIIGNVPTSPALGATGGALNVQKTTGGTAIYNARFLDSFGNTNAQIIGVNTEQLLNPSSSVNYLNFVHVDEGAIPTTNTVNFTGGDQTATYGSMSDFGSGTLNSLSGGGFEGFNSGPATATLVKGVTGTANCGGVVVNGIPGQTQTPTNNGICTNIRAFDGVANNKSSGTVTNGAAFYAEAPSNTGGGTFTNAYGLFVADMTAAINNFAIKTGIGKVSIGDAATFNSTVQVSTLGVGAAPLTLSGVLVNNSNLTGTSQIGILSAPQCSSGATAACEGMRSRFDTAAASFNISTGIALNIVEGNKGAGSTISTEIGLNIATLSNGGTNFAIQTGANPSKFGGPINFANVLLSPTAPTISSGFGTSPSIATNNGTAAFTVNVGTGGTATNGVINLPTATNGWNCFSNNITAAAGHRADNTVQTASTTTSATIENQTKSTGAAVAWTASDIVQVSCFGR